MGISAFICSKENRKSRLILADKLKLAGFMEQLKRCDFNAELEIGFYAGSMVRNIDRILTAEKTEQCSEVNKLIKV